MIGWLGCLAVLTTFQAPPANADPTAPLASVNVALWPEYDRPAMLVILRASLAPSVSLPAVAVLPVPAFVVTPHAVAQRGEGGTLLVADYTREVVGEVAYVSINTQSHDVQLEYYADLTSVEATRSFVWQWPEASAEIAFTFEVQLPKDATGAVVTPTPERIETGDDGRQFLLGVFGKVAGLGTNQVSVRYARPQGLAVQSVAAVRVAEPVAPVNNPTWVWWVLALALTVFVASVVVFWRGHRSSPQS